MNGIKIKDVKEGVLSKNDETASGIRRKLSESGVFFVNIMGSPGCGKTTFLKRTIEILKTQKRIGVIK